MKPGTVIPGFVDGGTWSACFGLSWMDLILFDMANNTRIMREGGQYLRKVAGTMGVAGGRNEITAAFLASDAEWLWFVDTDMGFGPNTVDRLIQSAEDNGSGITGGLCFAQQRDTDLAPAQFHGQYFRIVPTLYEFTEVKETGEKGWRTINRYQRNAWQQVAGTGAACLLIHRDAAEAVGPDPFQPITLPDGGGKGTPRTYSEDLSFCIRAAAANITVAVDTSIKTTHHKGGLFLDETTYAMQQETLIQAKGHEIAKMAEWAARHGSGPFGNVKVPA